MILRLFFSGLVFMLLSSASLAQTPQLTGVAPSAAGPGRMVTVTGGPFTENVKVALGDRLLSPTRVGERSLSFIVPQIPEGDYLLELRSGEETSKRNIFFRVVLPSPSILSLDPQQVESCDLRSGKEVVVQGQDIQPGTRLLLDGAIIGARRAVDNTLSFNLSYLTPGLHQIQLSNPDGRNSLPVAFMVNDAPEIQDASIGEEAVTFYEMIISGTNFSPQSTLLVNGEQVTSFYPGSLPVDGSQQITPINPNLLNMDSVRYVDCQTLIYVRHPYSSQPKTILLQIVNPSGKESAVYTFTGP